MTRTLASTTQQLDEHLSRACELLEAGFHFEEGGCFAMALALRDEFVQLGVSARLAIRQDDFIHAVVLVGTQCYDYRGTCPQPPNLVVYEEVDFRAQAAKYGQTTEVLSADETWARLVIAQALSMTASV